MPNRLADQTSPYLLQHADNPVDWYPWGEEAFEKARAEDKPVFLSVGYSACHWCHVMAHESFEDPATAALMNERFVNIKVDREERPDVDAIYMNAVQALTGHGGWPMSVWLLPDGRPFYGGTYFPDQPRHGMPSFRQVLTQIADVYDEKRDAVVSDAGRLTEAISQSVSLDAAGAQTLSADVLDLAYQQIARSYDETWGGFGQQPKFPPSMTLELLLRLHHGRGWERALAIVRHTLDRMAWGGMYDQLGGGFHRYSVDNRWLVPHFEKMLYDNALLLRAYLHGWQVTGEPRYRQIVEQIAEYVRREMTAPEGAFYSSQDADSEGEEGKFFVWGEDELRRELDGMLYLDAVLDYWGVTRGPNFEGHSILWVPEPAADVAARHNLGESALLEAVENARAVLFEAREARVKPGRDDKVLTAWNGLMIQSLAEAGRTLGRADYTEMAAAAARFILDTLRDGEGRLLRAYKDGKAHVGAFLEDYAFFARGLLALYESTYELAWFEDALRLTRAMVERFWDDEAGFYDTAHDHETLITRPQDVTDNAVPAGSSAAVAVLLRMAILAGEPEWRSMAERVIARLVPGIQQYPSAFAYLACQLDFTLSEPHEVALVDAPGGGLPALLDALRGAYRPNTVSALRPVGEAGEVAAEAIPLLEGRTPVNGQAAAYVCRNYVCHLPVSEPDALRAELARPTG